VALLVSNNVDAFDATGNGSEYTILQALNLPELGIIHASLLIFGHLCLVSVFLIHSSKPDVSKDCCS
jgi:hypothetical protein